MKNSLFATFVICLFLALMAGEAWAQDYAYTDMSKVESITVKNGQIIVTTTDGSTNTLTAKHPSTVTYQFKKMILEEGYKLEDLSRAISLGSVVYTGGQGEEVKSIVRAISYGSAVVKELVVNDATINIENSYDSFMLSNVENVKFSNCTLSMKNFSIHKGQNLKSLCFYNCKFNIESFVLMDCPALSTFEVLDCENLSDSKIKVNSFNMPTEVKEAIKEKLPDYFKFFL